MKNFDDYLEYVHENIERFSKISIDKNYVLDNLTGDNLSAFVSDMALTITSEAVSLSLEYLRLYHEWMQEADE